MYPYHLRHPVVAQVKLNLESDTLLIDEQSVFKQFQTSNIGGVLHSLILEK